MKKLLSIIGAISLVGTSTLGVISCKVDNVSDCERNDIGNWKQMCPKDQPFKKVDNKYYVTIWRTTKEDKWKISLFNFINKNITNIDSYNKYILQYSIKQGYNSGLMLVEQKDDGRDALIKRWEDDSKQQDFFKSLYKWDTDKSIPSLPKIDDNGNIIV
ncbi:lipoprotein [Spiroplasma endosymbiont of Seladonia tumulorum]|uniref:lipoprotein n=1 Tax=Spiroplasma endosymbiont of Seladonia tumulorum TaxID=3066321 RepID=UPI0030CD9BAC